MFDVYWIDDNEFIVKVVGDDSQFESSIDEVEELSFEVWLDQFLEFQNLVLVKD